MLDISLAAQPLFSIGSFTVTNSLFLTLATSLLLIIFSVVFTLKIKLIPGKLQSALEMGTESFLGVMESTLGNKERAERYFPLIVTIFIFILASNILGLLPGVGSLTYQQGSGNPVPLFRSPAADLNFTLAFALLSVILANIMGMISSGIFKHLAKFFNFKSFLSFFVGILELISEFSRIISLAFRLFGNVFAGEVLLAIIFYLLPYLVPVPFLFLELFVGLIQAFVFSMITLVSIAMNTEIIEH